MRARFNETFSLSTFNEAISECCLRGSSSSSSLKRRAGHGILHFAEKLLISRSLRTGRAEHFAVFAAGSPENWVQRFCMLIFYRLPRRRVNGNLAMAIKIQITRKLTPELKTRKTTSRALNTTRRDKNYLVVIIKQHFSTFEVRKGDVNVDV